MAFSQFNPFMNNLPTERSGGPSYLYRREENLIGLSEMI
jgi:hypothetical protein